MKDRDASDVNAEFARMMAQTAEERASYAHTDRFCNLAHQSTMELMRQTQRIDSWNRWIGPLTLCSLVMSAIAVGVTYFR